MLNGLKVSSHTGYIYYLDNSYKFNFILLLNFFHRKEENQDLHPIPAEI